MISSATYTLDFPALSIPITTMLGTVPSDSSNSSGLVVRWFIDEELETYSSATCSFSKTSEALDICDGSFGRITRLKPDALLTRVADELAGEIGDRRPWVGVTGVGGVAMMSTFYDDEK